MSVTRELVVQEWSAAHPDTCEDVRDIFLPPALKPAVEALGRSGRLTIIELPRGLQVTTTSWIGRIHLGELTLTIKPKIDAIPLTTLLRYAYGLRDLRLQPEATMEAASGGMQDLLVLQLIGEARELIARGLHRDYERRSEGLAMPRGRIAFEKLPGTYGRARAVLPCVHYPRTLRNALNVALAGSLALGARMAGDAGLRLDAWRLAQDIGEGIPAADLTAARLEEAEAKMTRRNAAYRPALIIARLLLEGAGLAIEEGRTRLNLPGFLFDMNMFFQVLVTRFLKEHLDGHVVQSEHALGDMYAWHPDHNPQRWPAPRPRPDILIMDGRRVRAILDAKYRDLWQLNLPSEMLYQLTLYALGHRGETREATIIYPSTASGRRDQTVVLRDPWSGDATASVVLRACDLAAMSAALQHADRPHAVDLCMNMATRLAVGEQRGEALRPLQRGGLVLDRQMLGAVPPQLDASRLRRLQRIPGPSRDHPALLLCQSGVEVQHERVGVRTKLRGDERHP